MLKVQDRYEPREVGVAVLSMSGYGYTESQLISQSEETMWPQLMCCALPNPLSSQFRTEVRVSGGECPEGQGLRGAYSLERLPAKELIQRTERTRLTGDLGFRVDMKSEQDFVIVDSEDQSSDVTNDQSVELVDVRVDILVGDSELVFRLNRRMTGVGDEYTHVEYIIGNQGCRGSGGDKTLDLLQTSDLSNPRRFEEAGL